MSRRSAKRRILAELVEHLERDRSMADAEGVAAIDELLVEFRRRGRVSAPTVPEGQDPLPGVGLWQIDFTKDPPAVTPFRPTWRTNASRD